jgi:hypothetical protein
MARASSMVVAKDTICVVVGARPVEYKRAKVLNRRTDQVTEIDIHEVVLDEGDEGIAYTFKAGERVPKNHPAVKACPGAFVTLDESEAELVA